MSRFRESNLTLGQVIKATYKARDAHDRTARGASQGAPAGIACQASGERGQTPAGEADRRESGCTRHEGWHCAMPSFPAWAMQGGAVMPQRPAQVRCDPWRQPSLRDAESRSQGVSGGEEVLRVPWGGGGLPHRVRTLAPPHRIPGNWPVDGRPHVWSQYAPGEGFSVLWLEGAAHRQDPQNLCGRPPRSQTAAF